jgi:hypothetical protein
MMYSLILLLLLTISNMQIILQVIARSCCLVKNDPDLNINKMLSHAEPGNIFTQIGMHQVNQDFENLTRLTLQRETCCKKILRVSYVPISHAILNGKWQLLLIIPPIMQLTMKLLTAMFSQRLPNTYHLHTVCCKGIYQRH